MVSKPNHESDIKAIRRQLLRGWRISVQSVLSSVGTQELRHYISKLRREPNLNIGSEWVYKNGKHFKEYFIRKEIKAA